MDEFAVWSTLQARPGKEREAEEFLHRAKALIDKERGTTTFFAMKIGPGRYATFDTMVDGAALDAHVHGAAAALVAAEADALFVRPPEIIQTTILTAKVPGD